MQDNIEKGNRWVEEIKKVRTRYNYSFTPFLGKKIKKRICMNINGH